MPGLIWVQTVSEGCQQMTLVGKELTPLPQSACCTYCVVFLQGMSQCLYLSSIGLLYLLCCVFTGHVPVAILVLNWPAVLTVLCFYRACPSGYTCPQSACCTYCVVFLQGMSQWLYLSKGCRRKPEVWLCRV